MNTVFVILCMVFFHIIDDFVLQAPTLRYLKQKSYWEENAPDRLYKYDYIMALIMHSISWTFMIMLPLAFINQFNVDIGFVGVFVMNVAVHASVDHMKANLKIINLWHDQLLHMFQIALTAILLLVI